MLLSSTNESRQMAAISSLARAMAVVRNEKHKGVEFFVGKMDRHTVGEQGSLLWIKYELAEVVDN
jgi:hypothetical protein